MTRSRAEAGAGLILLVMLIGILTLAFAGTMTQLTHLALQTQLSVDEARAVYLAQAGVMRAVYDWRTDSNNEANRRYAHLDETMIGNQGYRTGCQADFVYYSFDLGQNAEWVTSGGRRRLRRFRMRNIHTSIGGTSDNVTVTHVKVSWSPAGSAMLRAVSLNGTSVVPAGSYASGTEIALSGTAAQRTRTPGQTWSGNNTYLEWTDTSVPDPVSVTVQWTFADDGSTVHSKSHVVTYWDGDQAGAGRPAARTFSVTSTGQVAQTAPLASSYRTIKAVVSGAPGGGNVEITGWERIDKNLV